PSKPGYRSASESGASPRNIWTWVGGARVAFTSANANVLAPWLNLGEATCAGLLKKIGVCGSAPLPACPVPGPGWPAAATTQCAEQVIHYVRGWDVTDQDGDGCAGPANPSNAAKCPGGVDGEERDRANDGRGAQASFWKLGDIFHSSPVQVRVPAREAPCLTGLENQCVATIFSPTDLPDQTSIDRSFVDALGNPIDAYQRYRLDQEARTRVVLAGANDGLVHAFDAGTLDVAASATSFDDVYSSGTGEERWAFIPPDLLPKLKDSVFAHQYLADGSIMVRDVWVDLNGDGVKNRNEFKTVAVIPEQSGGTQWTALDVTDPLAPTVLWAFPQPGSSDAQWVGYSWTDFAPRPPPVGPVKLKVAGGAGNDPTSRGFEERWIVMLNGGYDPTLTRGRAVFMLDAWTGQTLWRYTDADFRSVTGAPAGAAMLPVPGAVGLVDVGDTAKAAFDNDGFFDTATWGDLGGNLFVARFHDPGVVGGGGQVTNWFAARAFEEQRSGADTMDLRSRSEFYFMTANAYEGASRTLRTFIGSGNREQFLKGEAPSCGQDDVMACCQAGCSVTATTSDTFPDSCNVTRQFTCTGGVLTDVTHASTCGPAPACVAGSYTGSETLSFNCGPGTGTTSLSASMSCDAATATCPDPTPTIGATGVPITAGGAPAKRPKSRFYGVWSYGKDPHKVFGDAASARTFDQNRFTDVPFAGCTGPVDNGSGTCTLVETTQAIATANAANRTTGVTVTCAAGAKCEAGTFDAGWFYEYGVRCPTATCPTAPPWWDEKTGSGANVVQGCVPWNGFRPTLTGGGGDPCVAGGGQPIVNAYAAHFVSGTPTAACGYAADDGKVYTAQLHSSIAAPVGPRTRIAFGQDGTVTYSVLTLDAGAAPGQKAFGTRSELMEPVYWLEVSRQLHQCRHVDPTTCQ
ncbi:MAG TPA: hypothetical protein VH880_14615, partial [Anaeromyxobacteraceae bacterium]